jgi:K(+)-stimulated pyrophosphate-energized sodium pump
VDGNVQGIADTSNDVEGEAAQALTRLDAIGNITKGITIAMAVLTSIALTGVVRTTVESALGAAADTVGLSEAQPNALVGIILGTAVVFLFARVLSMAVGRAAQRTVLGGRNQFREHPGIMSDVTG